MKSSARTDLALLCVAIALALLSMTVYEEAFEEFVRTAWLHGHYQLDEILTILTVFALGLGVFSWRRWRELQNEIAARQSIEAYVEEREFWLAESQKAAKIGTYSLNIAEGKWSSTDVLNEIFGIDITYDRNVEGWLDIVHPEQRDEMAIYLNRLLTERTTFDKDYRIIRQSDNIERWVYGRGELILDQAGTPVRMVGTIQDITGRKLAERELQGSLREKEILLQEVHHRVKNNMAIVTSLLELQSMVITDEAVRQAFRESRQRIKSIALVHEKLYKNRDFKNISIRDYIDELVCDLSEAYGYDSGKLSIRQDIQDISLNLNILIPFGLIINEVITNSLKHAFENVETPKVEISFCSDDRDMATLTVSDNGMGLPDNGDISGRKTVGLQVVNALVNQIGGHMEIDGDKGTRVIVTFPLRMDFT